MKNVYQKAKEFRKKYWGEIAWRVRKHSSVCEKHLNKNEKVVFVFPAQKNESFWDIFQTCVVVLTNKRILIGRKRLLWGYFFNSITPDLYNDLQIYQGLIWGKVTIDTVKESIVLSNLPKNSLTEIETNISELMMREKQKYVKSSK